MGQGDPGGQHQAGAMKSRPKIGKTFHNAPFRERGPGSAFGRLAALRQLDWWRRLQGGLPETLGVPLSGLRKRNNGVSERRTNRVVVAGSGAERPERHLERDAHETDCFAVKRLTV